MILIFHILRTRFIVTAFALVSKMELFSNQVIPVLMYDAEKMKLYLRIKRKICPSLRMM